MFINFYIARPTYCFILMYTCGLTVVIKRICYVMLGWLQQRWRRQLLSTCVIADWRHSLDLRADKRRSARTFCLPRRSQKYQRRLLPASLANTGRCDLDTVKSCYGNASVGPHRLRCRDRSIEFARWRQCALLSRTWVNWAHRCLLSPQQHVDRFSRFCRFIWCAEHTDRRTDLATLSVEIGRNFSACDAA